jgi:molybdopterin molybdotransferase
MLKVEEARKIILENTRILESETIYFLSALNRVLAKDIYSTQDIPAFNNSAMDGYAVVCSTLKGSSKENPVSLSLEGRIAAGHTLDALVKDYSAIKIMTGAPMPEGADAVVPVEFTEAENNTVKIFKEPSKWDNIRFAGEDIKKGQLVIKSGTKIRPAEIGMLSALNIKSVTVTRRPKISILATGDELAHMDEELSPGKIRNINSYSLYAEALKHECIPTSLGVARDRKEEIAQKLKSVQDSDILIISGGVSVGDYDYVKDVLKQLGMRELFWKVAIKPGKPVLFGVIGSTLVFGIPGNPVSALVTFRQFILPAIYKMQGIMKKPWIELKAVLEEDIEKKQGLTHFLRGITNLKDGKVYVKTTGTQSSGAFSSMVISDCLIIIPEEVTDLRNGEEVMIQITEEIGG